MVKEVTLSSSQRNSLMELRDISTLTSLTNKRLTTGNKVNDLTDDAAAYFLAKALTDRADTFTAKKDMIDQGISTVTTSLNAIESINELLDTMKGIVSAISSQSDAEKVTSTASFKEIGNQISNLVEDAYYNGVNLLNSTAVTLDVSFSDRDNSAITLFGYDFNAAAASNGAIFSNVAFSTDLDFLGISVLGVSVEGFSAASTDDLTTITTNLDNTISRLQAASNSYAASISVLNTRFDFSEDYIATLEEGAGKLTLADMDEEAAKLSALQTRQELSIQSLAISGDMASKTLMLLTD